MAFFKRLTTNTQDDKKRNAVIMGRKTWESIPAKFRPLPNRLNIILTRTMSETPEGVHIANSLESALEYVEQPSVSQTIEQIFIIGGSSVYQMALELPLCYRIYLTRVYSDATCDTFLPEFDSKQYKLVQDVDVPADLQEDNGIQYKFEVYERLIQ